MLLKRATGAAATVLLATSLYAQIPGASEGPVWAEVRQMSAERVFAADPRHDAVEGIRGVLGLSDAQVRGIQSLIERRDGETRETLGSMTENQMTLDALLATENAPALEVGQAMLAVRDARSRMNAIRARFRQDVEAILNGEQQARLAALRAAAAEIAPLSVLSLVEAGYAGPGLHGGILMNADFTAVSGPGGGERIEMRRVFSPEREEP